MELNEIIIRLNQFRDGETEQNWVMDPPIIFENDYIEVLRIDSSNVAGGSCVINGKQWSVIVRIKKDFRNKPNWIKLKSELKDDINVTKVTRGENCGNSGIRLYRMSRNMDGKIIKELLEFIFE
ncbi:MAG: hypothetical protein Ta2F_12560 [Termitinemataceae bacterium]|nr:MAG: hypothetical protein Ta2F_12560 [Termitinemataceae bacterium]